MLMQEVQHSLIPPLILLPHLVILQIRPRRHPPMDLAPKRLHIMRRAQVVPEPGDIRRVLVLARQQRHRHIDALRVLGVQHRRVALHRRLEGPVLAAAREHRDLAAPAVAEDGPVEGLAGEGVGVGDDARDLGQRAGRRGLGLEEVAELGLVVVGLGREPADVGGLALEEVGHEDAVFLRVGGREDVGALEGLGEEAEDVWSVSWGCGKGGKGGEGCEP